MDYRIANHARLLSETFYKIHISCYDSYCSSFGSDLRNRGNLLIFNSREDAEYYAKEYCDFGTFSYRIDICTYDDAIDCSLYEKIDSKADINRIRDIIDTALSDTSEEISYNKLLDTDNAYIVSFEGEFDIIIYKNTLGTSFHSCENIEFNKETLVFIIELMNTLESNLKGD